VGGRGAGPIQINILSGGSGYALVAAPPIILGPFNQFGFCGITMNVAAYL
jgi:hypothetical protein